VQKEKERPKVKELTEEELARIFHEASLNQKFKCKFNIKKIISSKMINV